MSFTPPTIVVNGPPGSGKTRYAEQIKAFFGCTHIIDDAAYYPMAKGALHLTSTKTDGSIPSSIYSIDQVLKEIGIK